FRSHAQRAAQVEPGQRASSGSDGVNVEYGNADGQAGDLGFVGSSGSSVNQGDIRRGATHIKGDDPVETAAPRNRRGSTHAARRSGEQRENRLFNRRLQSGETAARLSHV